MPMRQLKSLRLLACFGVLTIPATAPAATTPAEGKLTLGTSLYYSSGDYDGTESVNIWSFSARIKYELGRSTLKLSIPYLSITSPAGTVIDPDGQIVAGTGARATEEGLGDVVLAYGYSLLDKPAGGWLLDMLGKVKFSTGDDSRGLSSGETDYALQADAYYLMGAATPFFTLGYRVPGDPDGINYRNQWYGTVGLSYKLSKIDSAGAMWDMRKASLESRDPKRELTLFWTHKFGTQFKVQTYGSAGFSEAVPDYALGATLTYVP
jgi:hypothetical protein